MTNPRNLEKARPQGTDRRLLAQVLICRRGRGLRQSARSALGWSFYGRITETGSRAARYDGVTGGCRETRMFGSNGPGARIQLGAIVLGTSRRLAARGRPAAQRSSV